MSAPIFISYSSQDLDVAETLCEALESRGYSCWISSRDIKPGENFQASIVRAIREATAMVVLFSRNSNKSEEIKKEIALAGQSRLLVVPVRIEDVAPDEAFAYEFATRQWIDLFEDWESAIARLAPQLAAVTGITPSDEELSATKLTYTPDQRVQRKREIDRPDPAVLSLPDKPSIGVLPFQNMSGDPEQEYFVDGMVEEIITALSRIRWIFVIARNSTFTYKGQPVDVKQVGRELGVRYVLVGSVRKAGDRVRITGQLIDALTGIHLWADRFDGSLDYIFELQDQVASSVVGAIEPKLRLSEIKRAGRKPIASLGAYDLYLRALAQIHKMSRESWCEAVQLLRQALHIDPSSAPAGGLFAWCRAWQQSHGWETLSREQIVETVGVAQQAVDDGKDDPEVLSMAGWAISYFSGDHTTALGLIERALVLNPNSAVAWNARGWVLTFANRPDPAIESFERAMRLSPLDPLAYLCKAGFAIAHMVAGRYHEAMGWVDQSLQEQPRYAAAVRYKASLCGLLGRAEEGREWVRRMLELYPGLTIASLEQYLASMNVPELAAIFLEGMRKAGLS